MIKVAISTSNGKTVDQHFGKATSFYVYKLTDGGLDFLEKRDVDSYCTPENAKKFEADHSFNTSRFDTVWEVIKDCQILYTQRVGDTPAEKLKQKGMEVQLCSCDIKSIGSCKGECAH